MGNDKMNNKSVYHVVVHFELWAVCVLVCVTSPGIRLHSGSSPQQSQGSSDPPGHLGETRLLRLILAAGDEGHFTFKDKHNTTHLSHPPNFLSPSPDSVKHLYVQHSVSRSIPYGVGRDPIIWQFPFSSYLARVLEPRLCNEPWIPGLFSGHWCRSRLSGCLSVTPAAAGWCSRSIFLQNTTQRTYK